MKSSIEYLPKSIQESMRQTDWDFGNQVLYDLCSKCPDHKEPQEIIAKVWLIGRAYAASVERQKKNELENDNYYQDFIAPILKKSELDKKLTSLKKRNQISQDNIRDILSLHFYLIKILKDEHVGEGEQNRRSFSSKYLHFHVPELFPIYDSRSSKSLKKYIKYIKEPLLTLKKQYKNNEVDSLYVDFFLACYLLKKLINEKYDQSFNVRHLDNLLLYFS